MQNYYQKIKNIYHWLQSLRANIKYGFPAKNLKVIGVTGTDGKTTSVSMIYHVLKKCGYRVGVISTVNIRYNGREIDSGLHVTTPEPWETPKILREMVNAGIKYVVVEATSSGLDQNRLYGITFDSSLITFIGSDHLDYHGSQEKYANAKFKLLKKTKKKGLIVLNNDHESSEWLKRKALKIGKKRIKWFSMGDLGTNKYTDSGIHFKYKHTSFDIPIVGKYNFYNTLGAIKICENYIKDIKKISNTLQSFHAPIGRMQIVQKKPIMIIVDFAHTTESLEVALETVNKIRPSKASRIITIFGCAGRRDPRRRKMGMISAKLADITLVSIEDPRDEDLEAINTQIIKYAEDGGAKLTSRFYNHNDYLKKKTNLPDINIDARSIFSFDYSEVQNRKDAINFAMFLAKPGDVVFITGKAHEKSLAIGERIVEYKYSDLVVVKEELIK